MPKKPYVKKLMDSQHIKGPATLLKYARQYFCHIFLSLWKKVAQKIMIL